MKTNLLTENKVLEWMKEIEEFNTSLLSMEVPPVHDLLIPEYEVCEILKVTSRTMRKYRMKKYLRYVKIEGRIYYIKLLLYLDLILLASRR